MQLLGMRRTLVLVLTILRPLDLVVLLNLLRKALSNPLYFALPLMQEIDLFGKGYVRRVFTSDDIQSRTPGEEHVR